MQEAVEVADAVATSNLAYVETISALARMHAGKRLTTVNHRSKRREFGRFWSSVAGVEVSLELIERGGDLAERHALRAYDAIHLASALLVREAEEVAFSCWDKELRAAAIGENFELKP